MSAFKVSQKAQDDLLEIGMYTQNKWGVGQRDRYLDEINMRFHQLANNPNHPTAKNISSIANGCFSLLINEHIIIYKKVNYGVRIIRILSQSMDLERHL